MMPQALTDLTYFFYHKPELAVEHYPATTFVD